MQKVSLVVLFCDISDFLGLSVGLGERMPEFVQQYYEVAGDAVVSCGGSILKYIGDAVLCVFPTGREKEAVRCALRMRGAFAGLLRSYSVREGSQLGVAVSSGEVTRGVFGHQSLRLDDIMGDIVMHAAILNRIPGIKVTDKVREAVMTEFTTTELPSMPMKGKPGTLRAWSVQES